MAQEQPNIFDKIDYIHSCTISPKMTRIIIEDDDEIDAIYTFYKANINTQIDPTDFERIASLTIEKNINYTDTILLFFGYFFQMKKCVNKMLYYYGKLNTSKISNVHKSAILNCIEYYKETKNDVETEKYTMMLEKLTQQEHDIDAIHQTTIDKYISEKNDVLLIDFYNENIKNGDNPSILQNRFIIELATIYDVLRETDKMISILKLGISKNNVASLIKLTEYYIGCGEYQNIELMKNHYIMAICNGCMDNIIGLSNEYIFCMLGKSYFKMGKKKRAIKFHELAIQKDYEPAMLSLATYYLNTEANTQKYIEYLMLAIDRKKSSLAMNELGIYYLEQSKNPIDETCNVTYIQFYNDRLREFSFAYNYLMMAYTYDYENAHIIGDIFKFKGEHHNMMKYYNIALDYENNDYACEYASLKMAEYFLDTKKDQKTAINYLLLAIKMHSSTGLYKLNQVYIKNNEFDKFIDFIYNEIINECNLFIRNQYKKMTLFLESRKKYVEIQTCSICYENKNLIPFDCFCHVFCTSCYIRIDRCALCKFEKHPSNKNLIELGAKSTRILH
jgi:tetratricopeptide (TPR) repeat protein